MTEENQEPTQQEQIRDAEIRAKRRFSIIWIVPLVAVITGGWLLYKAWSETGPTITITFDTAEGLEAEKTKIKYKDVVVGHVTTVVLSQDIQSVVVTAQLEKGSEDYLTENTRFWVVRARMAAGEVSGLSTLFSGAYIGIEPSQQGASQRQFRGLSKPPRVTANMPGRHFTVTSIDRASLDIGSPVYYRQIRVGQVVDYHFTDDRENVDIKIFIHAPYHENVQKNTRFWNAGGVDVKLNADGIMIDTQSLVSIMLGGLAFDVPHFLQPGGEAPDGSRFPLYRDRQSIEERVYTVKEYYIMYFDQNIRGLSSGAPVEFRGIKLGEVVDVKMEFNLAEVSIRTAVLVMIEPERISTVIGKDGSRLTREQKAEEISKGDEKLTEILIEKGLRAKVELGSLVTGKKYIELDFHPQAPPQEIVYGGEYPVFPTIPAPLEEVTKSISHIVKNIEKIRFDQIGEELQQTVHAARKTLNQTEMMFSKVNEKTIPSVNQSVMQLNETLIEIERVFGSDSAFSYNSKKVLDELTAAVRALRELMESLERDPQSLLLGKKDKGDKE